MLPEEMANQSVKLKEEQLRREEEKLREIELKVQREIQLKRQELLAKEDSLKVLEARLGRLVDDSADGSRSKPRLDMITMHLLRLEGPTLRSFLFAGAPVSSVKGEHTISFIKKTVSKPAPPKPIMMSHSRRRLSLNAALTASCASGASVRMTGMVANALMSA